MASEYKKRGGGYNTTKEEGQDESQKHLDQWTKEDWQTKEGSGTARKGDGTEKRYLPKKAWEQMNDDEKEKTEEKKLEGLKKGKQFVGNTSKAKEARKDANQEIDGRDARNTRNTRSKNSQKQGMRAHSPGSVDFANGILDDENDKSNDKQAAGTKRRAKQSNGSAKKQKNDGQESTEKNGEDDENDEEEDKK